MANSNSTTGQDAGIFADVDSEDAVLLKSAAGERVQRVTGSRGQRAGANRSADAQAWTMGGNVD
jgi:hypothetical protein